MVRSRVAVSTFVLFKPPVEVRSTVVLSRSIGSEGQSVTAGLVTLVVRRDVVLTPGVGQRRSEVGVESGEPGKVVGVDPVVAVVEEASIVPTGPESQTVVGGVVDTQVAVEGVVTSPGVGVKKVTGVAEEVPAEELRETVLIVTLLV